MRSLERAKSHEDVRRGRTKAGGAAAAWFSPLPSLSLVLDHGNFNLIGNQVGGSSSLGLSAMPKKHCFTVFGIQVSNVPIF